MPEPAIDSTISNTALDDKYVALLASRNNTAQVISQKVAQAIEKRLPQWFPQDLRQEFLQTTSESISHHAIEELKKYSNLNTEEHAKVEKKVLDQAIENTREVYEAFSNLLDHKNQKQIAEKLENIISLKEVQQAAQTSSQIDKLEADHNLGFQSPQDLAKNLLDKVEKDYGEKL